jgi:hypothetical protein
VPKCRLLAAKEFTVLAFLALFKRDVLNGMYAALGEKGFKRHREKGSVVRGSIGAGNDDIERNHPGFACVTGTIQRLLGGFKGAFITISGTDCLAAAIRVGLIASIH